MPEGHPGGFEAQTLREAGRPERSLLIYACPIAMGEFFTKLTRWLDLERISEALPSFFNGLQFGAKHSLGCEFVISNARNTFNNSEAGVIGAADLESAFNSISAAV